MDFKTYMRAKELAEYQAIVMYDKLQLDSPQWKKYYRRQRQAKEFTRRIMSMARKLEKRVEQAEADNARLRTWLTGIRDGTITQSSPMHAADYALRGLTLTNLEAQP